MDVGRAVRYRLGTGEMIEEWLTSGSPRVTCPLLVSRPDGVTLVLTTAFCVVTLDADTVVGGLGPSEQTVVEAASSPTTRRRGCLLLKFIGTGGEGSPGNSARGTNPRQDDFVRDQRFLTYRLSAFCPTSAP